jgi:sugar transferase (PEP-CTERM/EpsH1 system associated)
VIAASPLIAHIIYSLHVGGLENGLVNLINRLPVQEFRHVVICLTDYGDFRNRIQRDDVGVIALNQPPGHGLGAKWRLWRLLRTLAPDIVHTRNIAALECQPVALLAGVPGRIHSEHGRNADELGGKQRRYTAVRRMLRPFVHHQLALSRDLEHYLREDVGVGQNRLTQVYNGVDTERFRPDPAARAQGPLNDFAGPDDIVFGTVGRMDQVKDPLNAARAFIHLCERHPSLRPRLKLVMVGNGSERPAVEAALRTAGLDRQVWLPGSRDDVPQLLAGLDVFVLPSLFEGISNTILEAMACGLPVVATRTGGNPELVVDGETGQLVPPAAPDVLADAMAVYLRAPDLARRHGAAARAWVLDRFSLDAMVASYAAEYRRLLGQDEPAAATDGAVSEAGAAR